MHLALDKKTNDLFKPKTPQRGGKGVVRVTDGRFVVQQVSCKLKTLLGEWILDDEVGFLRLEDLVKNYDLFTLRERLSEIVINTKGVLELISVDIDLKDRHLQINFRAKTEYGIIDTSVPWDDTEIIQITTPPTNIQQLVTYNGAAVTVGGVAVIYTP